MYPLTLRISDKKILFVGGGKVATRKILSVLSQSFADITVISPEITDEIKNISEKFQIKWIQNQFDESLIKEDFFMAFICTDNNGLNFRAAKYLKNRGMLINVCDNKDISDFYTTAVFTFEDTTISVSSKGRNPERSKRVKNLLQKLLNNYRIFEK